MSEAEFERLLDAVRAAVACDPEPPLAPRAMPSIEMPRGANDNAPAWSRTARPEDWYVVT